MTHDRAYLEDTIKIVRNYRCLDGICWIRWVNDLADEVERLWGVASKCRLCGVEPVYQDDVCSLCLRHSTVEGSSTTEEYGQDVEAEPERLKPLFDRPSVFTDDTGWCPPYGRRTGA